MSSEETDATDKLEAVEAATICAGRSDWIDDDLAAALARYPLEGIETEFPHHVGSVDSPDGFVRPAERHPVFYGCFDWHSAVHSYWSLIRQLRLFDGHPDEVSIRRRLDDRLATENVQREVAHFEENESFEKPYGWGWFLRLAAELHLWEDDVADDWRAVLAPLEERIVDLVESAFLPQSRPFRVGTHGNTAFALACVLDYARVTGDDALESAAAATAKEFFEDDRGYPVEYEPLGWDFLSPSLTEADLLRRVLDADAFETWVDGFFPDVRSAPYDELLEPVSVAAGSDGGVELHLVGLNLSKAWCLAGIAAALDGHRYAGVFERSARRHAERGLERAFIEDYAGAHWLSTFVLYLLTRNDGGIAPGNG